MTPYGACCALLDALVPAFTEAGRPFDRAYVADGSANHEFHPALVVEWDGTTSRSADGLVDSTDISTGFLFLRANLSIYALRPIAPWPMDEVGNLPTPDEMRESALRVDCDATLILSTIVAGMGDGTLFGGFCAGAWFVDQTALIPEGQVVGSRTQIAVAL